MENKRRVIFFLQDAVGGAERITALIANHLSHDDFEITYCLIGCRATTSIKDFIPAGENIINIPYYRPFRLIWAICRILRNIRPQVVFSSVYNISNKLLLAHIIYHHAKVIIRCDNYLYTYSNRQQKALIKLYPLADIIIAQTEEMCDELVNAGIDSTKVLMLHNPIDEQTIDAKLRNIGNPYTNNSMKHFVASGRFAYQKGFDLLVKAFSVLCERRNDCDLYIIGDYEYDNRQVYSQIIEFSKMRGIIDRVHCIGYKNNPYPYIKFADCFVLSSRWEGLPNVLIESLYLGTPIAAFKCVPIIERIIDTGNTGYCAEIEDCESLAMAMEKSLDLGRVHTTYISSPIQDFIDLFC